MLVAGYALPASAQVFSANHNITSSITPETPAPNEEVSIRIQSFNTDLGSAFITWSVNGVEKLSGTGKTVFTFTTGNNGSLNVVRMYARTKEGETVTRDYRIAPGIVSLFWEAETYTPPLYRGKAQFTTDASLRVIALPTIIENGVEVSPANLFYAWMINGEEKPLLSGYGKESIVIPAKDTAKRSVVISVKVTSRSGGEAETSTTIEPVRPEILLYEKDPLLGILFNRAITGDFLLSQNEVHFEAFPFFFSSYSNQDPRITYQWRMNNKMIENEEGSHAITLRNENQEGTAYISLQASHQENLFQTAQKTVLINFKN